MATFPTCHDPTLRELLRLGLPQRYIAMVSRQSAQLAAPRLLNSRRLDDSAFCRQMLGCQVLHVHHRQTPKSPDTQTALRLAERGSFPTQNTRARHAGCWRQRSPPRLPPPPPPRQVHNPEYLNSTEIASMVADHDIRLLAISPHVGNYAKEVLAAQGVQVRRSCRSWGCMLGLVAFKLILRACPGRQHH